MRKMHSPPPTQFGRTTAAQPKMAAGVVPPPPTRYGALGAAQPKMAAARGIAPPPTRYGAQGAAQPKKGPSAGTPPPPQCGRGAIQRMMDEDDDYGVSTPTRAKIPTAAYNFAASYSVEMGYFSGSQVSKPGGSDLAATHVAPDAGIKHTLANACREIASGQQPVFQKGRKTIDRLVENTKLRNEIILANDDHDVVSKGVGKVRKGKTAHSHAKESNQEIDNAYELLCAALNGERDIDPALQKLHEALSTAPGNLPDYGLHSMFNQPVSDRYHLNATDSGSLTPISDLAADMGLDDTGIAVSAHGKYLITRQGGFFPVEDLSAGTKTKLKKVGASRTGIESPPADD